MTGSTTKSIVVITRAKEDSLEFSELLKSEDIESILLPCLEFQKPPDDYKALDASIKKNHEYNWVIFLSKKSAEVFFDRLLYIGGNLFNLAPSLKVACIGTSTKQFIETNIGFPVDFCPSEFNNDVFIKEFKEALKAAAEYNFKILLPRTIIASNEFIEDLENSQGVNVKIDLVAAYSSECPKVDSPEIIENLQKIKGLYLSQTKLTISFTSSQIARNFKSLMPEIDLSSPHIRVLSIGPKTTKTIKEIYGPQVKIEEPKKSTIKELANLLTQN